MFACLVDEMPVPRREEGRRDTLHIRGIVAAVTLPVAILLVLSEIRLPEHRNAAVTGVHAPATLSGGCSRDQGREVRDKHGRRSRQGTGTRLGAAALLVTKCNNASVEFIPASHNSKKQDIISITHKHDEKE